MLTVSRRKFSIFLVVPMLVVIAILEVFKNILFLSWGEVVDTNAVEIVWVVVTLLGILAFDLKDVLH